MLATLFLSFCLIGAAPADCASADERTYESVRITQQMGQGGVEDAADPVPMTWMECTIRGEQYASEWLKDHPKYRLAKWTCRAGKPSTGHDA